MSDSALVVVIGGVLLFAAVSGWSTYFANRNRADHAEAEAVEARSDGEKGRVAAWVERNKAQNEAARLRRYLKIALLDRGGRALVVEPVDELDRELIDKSDLVFNRVAGTATITLGTLPTPDERSSL